MTDLKNTSNWYKPLEKYEDELTVGQVYFEMSERKREFVQAAMRFAMGDCAILKRTDNAEVWDTFSENERLATFYLINEAALHKEYAFSKIEYWKILRE